MLCISFCITFVPVGGICTGLLYRVVGGVGIKYVFTRGERNTLKYVVYCWKEKKSTSVNHSKNIHKSPLF